jgi:hypothetical protein
MSKGMVSAIPFFFFELAGAGDWRFGSRDTVEAANSILSGTKSAVVHSP